MIDPSSGTALGTLRPKTFDWDILDGDGRTIATVERTQAQPRYCRFVARVDGVDVCQFTWAIPGLTAFNAELEISLCPEAGRRLDPAFAVALGPVLEPRARRVSHRANA